ncbi:MAG: LysE family translocator [Thermodesulfobacteriota bacterium]|nr:LysE family translocator [Thermodesulfobacteriota bacterium]
MIDLNLYFAFVMAAILIIVIPGPSVLFVIARSINLGIKGGILSIVGVSVGALCHSVAISLGLAKLFETSPEAFVTIKNIGCFYLIYLGIKTFLSKENKENTESGQKESNCGILIQGCLVELLNPKTALFFIAFLPQFTNETKGNIGIQLIALGLTFVFLGLISDGIYAAMAGRIGGFLKKSAAFRKIEKYLSGSVYCGLGLAGLFYKLPKKLLKHSI